MDRPFTTLGGARELPMLGRAGLRPLGAVLGLSVTQMYGSGGGSGFDGDERPAPMEAFTSAVARGRERMTAQADALGAAFVADAEFEFPTEFAYAIDTRTGRFRATGTAYGYGDRDRDRDRTPTSVTLTNLSGLDLARVLLAGYRPTGLAIGVSLWMQALSYKSVDLQNSGALGPFGRNVEHPDYTRAVHSAWTLARARLETEIRASGGEGVAGLHVHSQEIRRGTVAIVLSATAIRREGYAPRQPDPLLGIRLAR